MLGRTLVLVSHPDDETVGCGALMQRMAEPIVVIATDAAPRNEYFWGKHGSRLRYARRRAEEARAALSVAGVSEVVFLAEEARGEEIFLDQELYRGIRQGMELLAGIAERYRPQGLVTMAYEGGHPDHDVCSFLGRMLAEQYRLEVWEFPLYHRQHAQATCAAESGRAGELVYQRFVVPGDKQETLLEVTPDELAIKQKMLAAYTSQHPFLFEFDPAVERFRPQHAYDYSRPPHLGTLNYEAWQWPVTGRQVCAAMVEYMNARRKQIV